MLDNYLSELKQWLTKPYKEEGDVIDWLLFLGFVALATFLWTRVINRILD